MPRHDGPSHRSTLALPAAYRVAMAAGAVAVLWLAVFWSVSLA